MTSIRRRRAVQGLLTSAAVVAATLVALPQPAHATIDPNCSDRNGGPVQLWWAQDHTGATICLRNSIYNMANPATYFPNNGTGAGQRVWDNSASAANHDTHWIAILWSDPGYSGSRVDLNVAGEYGSWAWNLGSVTNKNSSLSWTAP
ncbi:hypothetical protein AB0J90_17860 [Micromonospora sp. NPDC049523]|uniref:hypothetical protein n=1 Tax=Micromonospora sp. NPDC049523 TaxID=3155921 RepID=UPI0034483460